MTRPGALSVLGGGGLIRAFPFSDEQQSIVDHAQQHGQKGDETSRMG
jgi:hypothetical protein